MTCREVPGKSTDYYDGLNQLVREDNQDSNTSTVYTYDNGGNIVSKSVYPYSTGELGTATSTMAYGYTDVVWGDKLTSYNGQTINYDNIGNPLSYRNGMSFTWEHGRQMKTFTNSEGSTWEYTYDASGYRTKKKLLNTTYEYMLDGSQMY